tara:strand:- start:238 stop:1035 length:798 start_codon:yes stop_codon:yes gene_type:complete
MWPGLQAVASKFQDKPVLFLAVNSGTPRPQMQAYMRKNRIRWPGIADVDRSFERSCGVPPVSLRNIYQVRIMRPDGKLQATSPTRMEQTLTGLIGAAKWNVDPEGLPPSLKTAWFQVEFGNFAQAATSLKKAGNSRKSELKSGATRLLNYVNEKLAKQIEAAETAEKDMKAWVAYKAYADAAVRYKGYEKLPKDLTATINKLKSHADVKKEVSALRILAAAKRKLYGKNISTRKSGFRALERLANEQSETQAGREAQKLIDSLGS